MGSMALRYFRCEPASGVMPRRSRHPSDLNHRRPTMSIKALADRGIAFAEAIPDSLVSLTARLAVGGVFWRSGQTKIDGFHIKDSTFFLFREEYMVPLLAPDFAA